MWGELLGTFLSLYNSQEAAAKLVLGWKNITRIDEMRVEVELARISHKPAISGRNCR
jgi:hypothetical protein